MLTKPENFEFYRSNARKIKVAESGDPELGPLKNLPGTWKNTGPFNGRGWNLIALPFVQEGQRRNYRLLMNQYNEELKFNFVDDMVPNRGIVRVPQADNADQLVVALDYQQKIDQIAAADLPESGLQGEAGLPIHHEPGLFLHMRNRQTDNFDVARLATIPHGNAATAIGRSVSFDGPPVIPFFSGFPIGVSDDIENAVANASDDNAYLNPYFVFTASPFQGILEGTDFPGFSPANPNNLLKIGIPDNVKRTTVLDLSTDAQEGGIRNIPFIEKQADAAFMRSIFWVMELDELDDKGNAKMLLAYTQFIFLDFFPRFDGEPGLIRWPHVSINMMEKVAPPSASDPYLSTSS
ncbi:heme-binding protein [Thiosocius teredinicola]|uniref:heme-binding protein n=1 Tax=Thiosocius teredinicola TaxID=1973002 RepID=UPI0009914120